MTDPLINYLVVGSLLFVLGALGFLTRRNLILMMLSAELMLHGVSLNLVAFSAAHGNYQGQAFTAFVLTVAACEAALALALTLVLYRRRKTLDVNVWDDLREPEPGPEEELPEESAPYAPEPGGPRLTPAGFVPDIGDGEPVPPAPRTTHAEEETPSHA